MDPITQGVLGASVAQSLAKENKQHMVLAFIVAFLAGGAADLDILIRIPDDAMATFLMHRHFTHALFFIPVGGFITGWAYWFVFARKKQKLWTVVFYATLGYATHGLLDACTSYGTVLFWPFSNKRVAWDIVSIIDPWVTVPMIVGAVCALIWKRRSFAVTGLVLGLGYLGLGFVQNQRAQALQETLWQQRGHEVVRNRAFPVFMRNTKFNGVYEATDGYLYTDALNVPLWGENSYSEGNRIKAVHLEDVLPTLSEAQKPGFKGFYWFADGYLYGLHGSTEAFADARYSQAAGEFRPMWGVQVFPKEPERKAERIQLHRTVSRFK